MPGPTADTPHTATIAIVGLGPRGVSLLERIAAASPTTPLNLALIEPTQAGAGAIWRTDQTRTLCMNTLADAVTLFTEPGATVGLPVVEGPTLYEWIRLIRGDRDGGGVTVVDGSPASLPDAPIPEARAKLYDSFPAPESVAVDFAEEIAATRPESNPSRALYGAYLRWAFELALSRLPDHVEVRIYEASLRTVHDTGHGSDLLELDNGLQIDAHATVLATGWTPPGPNAEEQLLSQLPAGLHWVAPANPVDQDLSHVRPGEKVIVRGLGMGFFDVMAMLTIDRGGRFLIDPDARSGLRYEPSGQEPHLVATSSRGYPFFPKSEYHSLPPAPTLRRLKQVIAQLSDSTEAIDFDQQVWPAISRDAHEAYYRTLDRTDPGSVTDWAGLLAAIDADQPVDSFLRDPHAQFRLGDWEDPLAGVEVSSRADLTALIANKMASDLREAELARDSAIKSALWEIGAARKPASILGAEGRYVGRGAARLAAFGQMVGSGPPAFRTRELLTLIDAGLVTFAGPSPRLAIGESFHLTAPLLDEEVTSSTLIDAWMHSPDLRAADDPLFLGLRDAGRARSFAGGASPEVSASNGRLVNTTGELDPRVHLVGIPTGSQLPDTTISPMPGTNPLMLQETDRVARSLLSLV